MQEDCSLSEPDKTIHCSKHGQRVATFVCHHLAHSANRGFNIGINPEYADDPFPDAWCDECEQKFEEAGGEWNDEAEEFADIRLICCDCYVAARLRNQEEELRRRFTTTSLQDIVASHKEAPRTFSIPRSDERVNLPPGQLVKLVFEIAENEPGLPGAERMWVEVKERRADGNYVGELHNQPYFISNVSEGTEVIFGPEHVAALYVKKDDGPWLDESLEVSCSEKIISDDLWPCLAERASGSPTHTGWRIYASDMNETLVSIPAQQVLDQFPVLDSVLGEDVGSSWKWDEAELEYKRTT